MDAEHTPAREARWRKRYKASPSFLSLHLGIDAALVPSGFHCHHLLLEDWQAMEDEQGVIFVSMPSLLDPELAPSGRHILHCFTPSAMEHWQGLGPEAYNAKKQADADRLIQRLETLLLPGLSGGIHHREVGTPRSHRRFLGRHQGSYGPIPALRLPGLLPMPFNRTGVDGLYCVGDSCFPGQGLNAVAFSGFACAHRIGADLGLNPGPYPNERECSIAQVEVDRPQTFGQKFHADGQGEQAHQLDEDRDPHLAEPSHDPAAEAKDGGVHQHQDHNRSQQIQQGAIAVSRFGKQHHGRERSSANGERDTDRHHRRGIKLRITEIRLRRAGSRCRSTSGQWRA